ncbi:MAG: tryptophan--tRNA ligase [Alphaproteobacteria bacterium]|nr:tryptophan--tRNA ligase [Alphaproteobacteria bacterium]MBE8220846.1 tryptophan--tRNA ligase [Alphaproteobacteria bacterium]
MSDSSSQQFSIKGVPIKGAHIKRAFSGVQPTGGLHLGNYLGAIQHFVALQDSHECLYCVVDLHAMTAAHDPTTIAAHSREVAAAFIAAGIDTNKHIVFAQSHVPQHAELAWMLECVARVGWLSRMTQFKEKAGKDRERASVGLYVYPILMAADILLYHSTHVPVGDDQKQHLELARAIAQKFNNDYATGATGEDFFPVPEPLIQSRAARVMSLRDGTKKMSKSDASAASRIVLTDDADTIARKIKKAKTDPDFLPDNAQALETRPEAHNLLSLHAALADMAMAQSIEHFAGQSFAALKADLSDRLIDRICPLGDEMRRLMADAAALDAILATGAARARAIGEATMVDVRRLLGLIGA